MKKLIDMVAGLVVIVAAGRAVIGSRSAAPDTAPADRGRSRSLVPAGGGRGRRAEVPSEIPAAGWKDILLRVKDEMKADNLPTIAAAMTYYGLLALFPALIAIVSLYGLVADPADVQRQIAEISDVLPEGAASIVTDQLDALVSAPSAGLGLGLVVSLGATLWSVSSGVSALIKAINLVYDEEETRGFVKLRLLALGLTVGIIVFVVAAVFVITALPAVLDAVGAPAALSSAVVWLRWPLLGLALMVGLAVFYRLAPNRDSAKWRWVTWGAVAATVIWLVASLALNFYVSNFANYNETYGTLGGVIVLLLWMFVSALIVLLGAEFDAELEAQTAHDTTVGRPQPMGARDAVKADRLGEPVAADR